MKRVLIDLEENGCTVKEAVDYLKGLGYREDEEHVVPYNTTIVFAWHNGIIDALSDRPTDIDEFCKAADYEKLTIKESPVEKGASLTLNLSFDEVLLVYYLLSGCDVIGASESTVEVVNNTFEKAEQCISSFVGFDPICIVTPSERKVKGDEFFRFSYAVRDEMMKFEQEESIVFSNPLMQHIGREVVVNDGRGNFTGWVVGVYDNGDLTVDLGVRILSYTHDADLGGGKRTYRWFKKSNVKFVNEDGSLSDE